ncbi:hypothetical protein D3C85_1525090 [compost metagenome]
MIVRLGPCGLIHEPALPADGLDLTEIVAVSRFRKLQMQRPLHLRSIVLMQEQQLLKRHFQFVQQQYQFIVAGIILSALKA